MSKSSVFLSMQMLALVLPALLMGGIALEPETPDESLPVTEIPTTASTMDEGTGDGMMANPPNRPAMESTGGTPVSIPSDVVESPATSDPSLVPLLPDAEDEEAIMLGQPQDSPYVVVIPGSRDELLDRVQAIVPTAFITDSRRGWYINAGSFNRRTDAEVVSTVLRHQGLDARVVYLRVR